MWARRGLQVEAGHVTDEGVSLADVVLNVESGEHPGDVSARLVHAEQLGHGVAQGLVTIVGAAERDLCHGVAQDSGTGGVPFGVVGVQQTLG
jgi:hypothetical protein